MGKADIREIETVLREAFLYAQDSRRTAGLGAAKSITRTYMRGPNRGAEYISAAGQPRAMKYKMTIWLTPFEYVDLLRLREALGYTLSPATLLRKLIRDATPPRLKVGTEPRPRAPLSERLKLRPGHGRRAA